jgi:Ca-activated chloride channel family protein
MRYPTRLLVVLFAILATARFLPAAAAAAPPDPSTPGALRVAGADGAVVEMPLRHTKVAIEVTAFVAAATIEQVFANPFAEPVEAIYTFPLGDRAAVDDFELQVGERTIRGEIKPREEARSDYERARAAGFQAALLEQERPNVFTQSVANLEPGKLITVRLRTVWTLAYERGSYRLTFPLVVGPRYIPGGSVADATRITRPVLPQGTRSGHDIEISVTIDAGVPLANLESPSHKTVVKKSGARGATVALASEDAIPNKDFLLRWIVSSEKPAVGLLAHRDGLDGFFTLLVQPKGEVAPPEATPKEITFVVDTSGSMRGIPLDASKRLAAKALQSLGPRDTFNLIRFAGDNTVLSKDPLPNDRGAIERAIAWLNGQQGGGGTELLPALQAAFARPADPQRLRVVVFLTDGFVGNDQEILGAIGNVIGDARIYTVGIGTSVNHYLLDRMADLGRGAYVFVRPDESADDALEAFRSWVTLPYVTDLAIDWGSLPVADLSPERLRDLGSGQTLTVVGRYLAAAEGNVVVRGKLGGRYFEQTLRVVFPEVEPKNEALSSLWARGRIEELLREPDNPATDAVKAEVTALAVSYRLMSPYTSFVAVDDAVVVNANGEPRSVRQALPPPEGVSGGVVGGVVGGVPGGVPGGAMEERVIVTGEAGAPYGGAQDGLAKTTVFSSSFVADLPVAGAPYRGAQGGAARVTTFSSEFISDLPVAGRFYQNVLALAPGVHEADDGNPNVNGARERDFKTKLGPEEGPWDSNVRLLDTAFRVLADLADDGELGKAEGAPALAALLAAQHPSGALAQDVAVHAVATWALSEAAINDPGDARVVTAKTKALHYLVACAQKDGWPARPGAPIDAETTRWARLVLAAIRPALVESMPVPAGEPTVHYTELRASLAAARSGGKPPKVTGHSSFDRLVRTVGRGHLKVVKTA